MPVFDNTVSVVIGHPRGTAAFLAYECQSLLTGEGVAAPVRESMRSISSSGAGVERVNELLTMHFGPRDVLVALSIDFNDRLPASSVKRTVTSIENAIKAAHPEVTRLFVEAQSLDAHRRNAEAAPEAV